MVTNDRIVCDAEILSLKRLNEGYCRSACWVGCNRKVSIEAISPYGMTLHFCDKHRDRAFQEGRTCQKTLSITNDNQ